MFIYLILFIYILGVWVWIDVCLGVIVFIIKYVFLVFWVNIR